MAWRQDVIVNGLTVGAFTVGGRDGDGYGHIDGPAGRRVLRQGEDSSAVLRAVFGSGYRLGERRATT